MRNAKQLRIGSVTKLQRAPLKHVSVMLHHSLRVMAGPRSQACADCVNLSAMPAIHVFAAERKAWMAATSAAMTTN
jgi:hypothetical protein